MKQNELKSKLTYCPDSGIFTKKKNGKIVGAKHRSGSIEISINRKKYQAHRLAWLYVYGKFPNNSIDHINHIRDDNRIVNLRDVTTTENNRNMSRRKDNTSGVTGVVWNKLEKRWKAQISINGNTIGLGTFVLFSQAVDARKNAEIFYCFHENHGKEK